MLMLLLLDVVFCSFFVYLCSLLTLLFSLATGDDDDDDDDDDVDLLNGDTDLKLLLSWISDILLVLKPSLII